MSEIKREVKTFEVRYRCDKIGCEGEQVPEGYTLLSNPPKYPHKCNQCGTGLIFKVHYPYMDHSYV